MQGGLPVYSHVLSLLRCLQLWTSSRLDFQTRQMQDGLPVCQYQLLLAACGIFLVVSWAHSVDHKASRQFIAPAG